MTHLLRLDASVRHTGSHSRDLANFFQGTWLEKYPETQITVRDVTSPAIPHLDELTVAGFQTPAAQRTAEMNQAIALSDELIQELTAADILLISCPMYNFSIPSGLKAWVDQIVRMGETFTMEEGHFKGLLKTQKAYICTAYGAAGYRENGPMARLNFLEPYLQGLFSFLGVPAFEFFALEGMMGDRETQDTIKQAVHAVIQETIN